MQLGEGKRQLGQRLCVFYTQVHCVTSCCEPVRVLTWPPWNSTTLSWIHSGALHSKRPFSYCCVMWMFDLHCAEFDTKRVHNLCVEDLFQESLIPAKCLDVSSLTLWMSHLTLKSYLRLHGRLSQRIKPAHRFVCVFFERRLDKLTGIGLTKLSR